MQYISLISMVLVYIFWFVVLAIVPFIPVYVIAHFMRAKERLSQNLDDFRKKKLNEATESHLNKLGRWGSACGCSMEKDGKVRLYTHFRNGKKEWNYRSAGANLGEAAKRMRLLYERTESIPPEGESKPCPNEDKCPNRVAHSPLKRILQVNKPAV